MHLATRLRAAFAASTLMTAGTLGGAPEATAARKPILVLDFDGVMHAYESGWQGVEVIPDPPVPGALDFIAEALEVFRVAILSSRSSEPEGIAAMQAWLAEAARERWRDEPEIATRVLSEIEWPTRKPPAFVTIDDRAITFTGTWPSIEELRAFRPWNRQ